MRLWGNFDSFRVGNVMFKKRVDVCFIGGIFLMYLWIRMIYLGVFEGLCNKYVIKREWG